VPLPAEEQVCLLYAGVKGYLDKIQTSEIGKFEELYLPALRTKYSHVLNSIRTELTLTDKSESELKSFLEEFMPSSGLKLKV